MIFKLSLLLVVTVVEISAPDLTETTNFVGNGFRAVIGLKPNRVKYVADDEEFETRLDDAKDALVVIFFRTNFADRSDDITGWLEARAAVNPYVVFLTVDTAGCPKTAKSYLADGAAARSFVFRKHRANVLRFEGDDRGTLSTFIRRYQWEPTVVTVTGDRAFDDTLKDWEGHVFIVGFVRQSSRACQLLAPVFEAIARRHARAVVLSVDVDRCRQTALTYGVTQVPTLAFKVIKFKPMLLARADVTALQSTMTYAETVCATGKVL